MSRIRKEMDRCAVNPEWTLVVCDRKYYIKMLESMEDTREALRVATTHRAEDRHLVMEAQRKINELDN